MRSRMPDVFQRRSLGLEPRGSIGHPGHAARASGFDAVLDPARLDFGTGKDLLLAVLEELIQVTAPPADDQA